MIANTTSGTYKKMTRIPLIAEAGCAAEELTKPNAASTQPRTAEPIPEPIFCPMEFALKTRPSARMPDFQSLYSTVSASIPYITPERAAFPTPLMIAAM